MRAFPDARLVAGATENAVEVKKKFRVFPRLVSVEAVPELAVLTPTPEGGWRIGGAVPLTAVEVNKKFRVFPRLVSVEAVPELAVLTPTPEGGW
ncbi:MAG: FAD binding domain-containing protein, partial [Opitutaceae bacterium]